MKMPTLTMECDNTRIFNELVAIWLVDGFWMIILKKKPAIMVEI